MTDTGDGSAPVTISVRKYTPGISDPVVTQARAAKKQARETRQANLPTGTETKKKQDSGSGDDDNGSGSSTGWDTHVPYAGCVLTSHAIEWKASTAWQTIASLKVPTVARWGRALLHVSAQGVAVSSGGRALRLRISVDGTPAATGLAAYAGPSAPSGGSSSAASAPGLSGDRAICMGVDVEAAQGATVTMDVYSPDDTYQEEGNSIILTARVDYKEAS